MRRPGFVFSAGALRWVLLLYREVQVHRRGRHVGGRALRLYQDRQGVSASGCQLGKILQGDMNQKRSAVGVLLQFKEDILVRILQSALPLPDVSDGDVQVIHRGFVRACEFDFVGHGTGLGLGLVNRLLILLRCEPQCRLGYPQAQLL